MEVLGKLLRQLRPRWALLMEEASNRKTLMRIGSRCLGLGPRVCLVQVGMVVGSSWDVQIYSSTLYNGLHAGQPVVEP